MPRHLLLVACSLTLAAAALATACSDNGNGGSATPTTTLEPTVPPTVAADTPTPSPDIRQEDLTQQPDLQQYLASTGGQATPDSILYADVTDDGAEDAIIPISSGGEGGNFALFVYGYQPAGIQELLRVTTQTRLTASVVSGHLQVTEAVYGPGDPLCCPGTLQTTTYQWDGNALVPEVEGQ